MKSLLRNSIAVLVVLVVLAPAAIAGTCPTGPFSPCQPFSVSGVWYSDATKTTVVGGWWRTCPNLNTCVAGQGVWGQRTAYSDVDCEPCDACGNCVASQSIEEGEDSPSCTLKAELEEVDQAEECGAL